MYFSHNNLYLKKKKKVDIITIDSSRRQYSRFVADESLEDYALRYTPRSFRKWSELLIANTALGSISFLALEAIGASIAIHYGFSTAFWAILTAAIIIFLTAIPISYNAAKHNIDIDLITRSAGFGYVGSTITSLIYASFSFIFFALEAAIMAQALDLYFGLPLALGYLFSSIIIIPMVFYGITFINKLQMWTQPIWLIMMVAPFIAVLFKEPEAINSFVNFSGNISESTTFNLYYFGFAVGISLSLIAQIGEQVDYLRFMPPLTKHNKVKWWFSVLIAGPGWIILGFLKQLGGIFLAGIVLLSGYSLYDAKTPIQMYNIAYQYIFESPEVALAVATFFVVVSQIKINVTNAYAGSLAWSNFFSRITYSHPGRVVWLVFNISIALLLMELGLFDVLEKVLGLYSNVAIAWIGAITADLVINKPFGLSPKMSEFKRAYLHDFNPVGVVSMGVASIVSILSFTGLFGDIAQSYSSIIAMLIAFLLSPLIAWFTKGKYYIARENTLILLEQSHHQCHICDTEYEKEDMAYCPFHQVNICSLCCSLDSLCHDSCKKESKKTLRARIGYALSRVFANKVSVKASLRLFDFFNITSVLLFVLAITAWLIYSAQIESMPIESITHLKNGFIIFFFIIAIFVCLLVWWVLLLQESRVLAESDLAEQNQRLKESKQSIISQKKALEDQKELYELVFKNTESGVLILDIATNKFIDCNEPAINILHWNKKEDLLHLTPEQISPEYQPDGQLSEIKAKEMIELAINKGCNTFEWKHLTKNKDEIWIEVVLTKILLDKKPVLHVFLTDIQQRKLAEDKLVKQKKRLDHQAHYDALTDLPNRVLFNMRFEYSIQQAQRDNHLLALFFIDLDHFKQINDSLGHRVGDQVLKVVSVRLKHAIRKNDSLARLGGDEFTILMENISKESDAALLAQKIIKSIAEPIYIDEHTLYVSSSIGISFYPKDDTDFHNLLMYADTAMYKAKNDGRNDFRFYRSEMTSLASEHISIDTNLRQALKNNELELFYQPQVNGQTGEIIGLEALIRWRHPTLGIISPAKFIPITEETGLIIEIDRWVMETAIAQAIIWREQGLEPGLLSVNFAMKQLHKKDFVMFLQTLLTKYSFKPQWLELEVTEGKIMNDPENAIVVLSKISELGVELAVDDFGTGYSSLAYLKRLPIDKLKIDQAFVKDLPENTEDVAISKAIIALAKSLNLNIVAEGVETQAQKEFLVASGCETIQGYFYSRPLPVDKITPLIKKRVILPDIR